MKTTLGLVGALIFVFSIIPASGQSFVTSTLWAPEEMLPQQEYAGIIVIEDVTDTDVVYNVVTNNDETIDLITDKVIIPKGKHHGIIKMQTRGTGEATIFAIYKDILLEKRVNVVESSSSPTKIDLILPSNLFNVVSGESKHKGYVFLLNEFDNPVTESKPVEVTLTSNGDITLPKNSIIIEPETHYAKFVFNAKGEGSISANAANLDPDIESITISDPEGIELKLAVAPDPIPTSSSAEIYFWLERDGKPYLPQHDVEITISIDKSTNLSFDSAMKGTIVLSRSALNDDRRTTDSGSQEIITKSDAQLADDSKRQIILKKGEYYGKIKTYSSFDAESSIQISGLANSISTTNDDETIQETAILTVSTQKSKTVVVTNTKVFAYPDPAYDVVEIVVSSDSGGPILESVDKKFTVFTNTKLNVASVEGTIVADENYGIVFAKVTDLGTAKIFAEREETQSKEIEIQIKEKYVKDPQISIVPLPVIFGTEQDLFLISSTHQKIVTAANSTNRENLVSITSKPSFDYTVIGESESVATVHGVITDISDEDPVVYISSNAFTATETLDVFNPKRKTIVSMHPANVFSGEPFPIINHIADLDGNPMKVANLRISSNAEIETLGNLMYVNTTGTHDIIFYDVNTIPIKSSIEVRGVDYQTSGEQGFAGVLEPEISSPGITYDLFVENGEGSGSYAEGTEVTINASPVIQDGIFRKVLVGWENLPYKEATVKFEIDDDVETRPIYQEDYTLFIGIAAAAAGVSSVIFIKKRQKKNKPKDNSEEELLTEEIMDNDLH